MICLDVLARDVFLVDGGLHLMRAGEAPPQGGPTVAGYVFSLRSSQESNATLAKPPVSRRFPLQRGIGGGFH